MFRNFNKYTFAMRKILIFIIGSLIVIAALTIFIAMRFGFSRDNTIAILGYFSIFSSAILLYFSLDVNLKYNKRKSAMDFSYDKTQKELIPLYKEMKGLVGKDFFFESGGKTFKQYYESHRDDTEMKGKMRDLMYDMLNFYERMAIGVLKNAYDEDICFDDNAFSLIHFYDWTKSYVDEFKDKYDKRSFVNLRHLAEKWRKRYEKQTVRIEKQHKDVEQEETIANRHL